MYLGKTILRHMPGGGIRRYAEGYSGGKYSECTRRGLTSRQSVAMRVINPAPANL